MEQKTLLDTIDPELLQTMATRREAIARGASIGAKTAAALALGTMPVMLGVLAKEARAQTASDVVDVLQFALLLEYLEAEFYTRGVAAAGLIPAADLAIFTTIRDHETAHVEALKATLTSLGATPGAKPTFDFTAHGNVPGFTFASGQYATFQALAMAFEDTGVRAYKGQAARLIGNKAVLNAALAIHSVEARHASEVRRLRGKTGWIVGNSREDLPAFTQGIYDGEDATSQAGVDLTTAGASFGGSAAITAAFDEPLTKDQVTAIVTPFLA